MTYFSRRFFISFRSILNIDPSKLDFRKGQVAYEFSGSKEKINHFFLSVTMIKDWTG